MRYRYMFLARGVSVPWETGSANDHAEALSLWGGTAIGELAHHLETIDGGGWEIVSHDLAQTADGAMLSIVARQLTSGG